ncbi:MAG TPA: hypothetical protein PKL48_15930 [Thermodesulfobacteriota bacterium]|nr:hypothetical protein [Thermodesulfobacteriota bacterium]
MPALERTDLPKPSVVEEEHVKKGFAVFPTVDNHIGERFSLPLKTPNQAGLELPNDQYPRMNMHEFITAGPGALTVSRGPCAIWLNRGTARQIKVVCIEGKCCANGSDAPAGISPDQRSDTLRAGLRQGGTSCLLSLQSGAYERGLQITMTDRKKGQPGKRLNHCALGNKHAESG